MNFDGIELTFTDGAKLEIPYGHEKVSFTGRDSRNGKTIFSGIVNPPAKPGEFSWCYSLKKYFIAWEIEFESGGKKYFYRLELSGKTVLIENHIGAIGDTIAWMPAVEAFRQKHGCRVICSINPDYRPLFESVYPEIRFIGKEEIKDQKYFAKYELAIWYSKDRLNHEAIDHRMNNLQRHGDMILGVDTHGLPPRISDTGSVQKAKRIAIATRASRKAKEWNYEGGWKIVTQALCNHGYEVVCIDRDNQNMPDNALDRTGNLPLLERVKLLRTCECFIGLPSGLSWLANACKIPVVLIGGFTDPYVDFETPYRLDPPSGVCHNCYAFEEQNAIPEMDYQCTKSIHPDRVIETTLKALKGK